MKTKNNNNLKPFDINEINWNELANIGILKDELELTGELDKLLNGERTKPIFLQLILLGIDMELDATLQLVRKNGEVLIDILGVAPFEE